MKSRQDSHLTFKFTLIQIYNHRLRNFLCLCSLMWSREETCPTSTLVDLLFFAHLSGLYCCLATTAVLCGISAAGRRPADETSVKNPWRPTTSRVQQKRLQHSLTWIEPTWQLSSGLNKLLNRQTSSRTCNYLKSKLTTETKDVIDVVYPLPLCSDCL